MTSTANGSCLCNGVTFEVTGNLGIFQYCHCSRCRKFTGSAFASNIIVAREHFRWLSGEDLIKRFVPEDTKHFATAFCTRCGSALPWLAKSEKTVIIPAGTLDSDPDIRPQQNVFCDSEPDWYIEPDSLPRYDQLPPKKNKTNSGE